MFIIARKNTDLYAVDSVDVIKAAYKSILLRDTIMVDFLDGKVYEVNPKDIENRICKRYTLSCYVQFELYTTKESVVPRLSSHKFLQRLYPYMKDDEAIVVDYKKHIAFCFPHEAMPKRYHQLKVIYAIRKKYRLSDEEIRCMFPEINDMDLQCVFIGYYSARRNIDFVYRRFLDRYRM